MVEVRGPVDVRVPVEHSEAHEARVLEARQRPEDPLLLANLELRLEAHEVEVLFREIVLPELQKRHMVAEFYVVIANVG